MALFSAVAVQNHLFVVLSCLVLPQVRQVQLLHASIVGICGFIGFEYVCADARARAVRVTPAVEPDLVHDAEGCAPIYSVRRPLIKTNIVSFVDAQVSIHANDYYQTLAIVLCVIRDGRVALAMRRFLSLYFLVGRGRSRGALARLPASGAELLNCFKLTATSLFGAA